MLVSDFDYQLPEELIAQHPVSERTGSRLLHLDGNSGALADYPFSHIIRLLQPDDLLVLNDTRVFPARLLGKKQSGGAVEVLVGRIEDSHRAIAYVRASKTPKVGARLYFGADASAEVLSRQAELFELEFNQPLRELLERHGKVPLPPYIHRTPEGEDAERYQTVYARREGAVAAPTAGLHFDGPLLESLEKQGVELCYVTLHVGAGTFAPVRVEAVKDHRLHHEEGEVSIESCAAIRRARAEGRRVVAVGTTSVRILEAAVQDGEIQPFLGSTNLFIYPGYEFRCVDALVTNFHLPRSSLLMLVSAFAGRESVLAAYRHAVAERYRFFSYGDAMFITRSTG